MVSNKNQKPGSKKTSPAESAMGSLLRILSALWALISARGVTGEMIAGLAHEDDKGSKAKLEAIADAIAKILVAPVSAATEAVKEATNLVAEKISDTMYRVVVRPDLESAISAGKYEWNNSDVTSEHFPLPTNEVEEKAVTVELFKYDRDMLADQVVSDLATKGYRPATVRELTALALAFPDLQREFPITALGSVWTNPNGRCYVACLYWVYGSRRGRNLNLDYWDFRWNSFCRFAAVRISN